MATYKVLKDYSQYEISDNGIIRKIVSKAIIKQRVHPREGLMMCDLYDNNLIARTVYPHKEVAKTFIPTKKKGRLLVIHKNGKKKDNKVENLQWITMGSFQKLQVERGTREQMGNPELYKHSKFWKEKNKKQKAKSKSEKTVKAVTKGITTKVVAKPKKTGKILPNKITSAKKKQISSVISVLKKAKAGSTTKKTTKSISVKKKVVQTKGKKVVKASKPALKKQKVVKQISQKAVGAKVGIKKTSKSVTNKAAKKKNVILTKVGTSVSLKSNPVNTNEVVRLKTKPKRNRIKAKKVFSVKN